MHKELATDYYRPRLFHEANGAKQFMRLYSVNCLYWSNLARLNDKQTGKPEPTFKEFIPSLHSMTSSGPGDVRFLIQPSQ